MRILMWTPLPPESSGIADYSYELLEAMSAEADVTAVSVHSGARVPPGVGLAHPGSLVDEPGAVNVYQMGNNTEFHLWIHERAMAVPGVVVLHDTSLLDFTLSHLGGVDAPAFRDEMRFAHGPIWGDRDDPALLYGWPAVDVDGVKHVDRLTMTMERRIVSASLGVIVHDPFRAGWLSGRYPDKPVFTVASGAPVLEHDDRRAQVRARFGWDDDHVVFGVFGGFTRIKRILVAVSAFAQVRRRWPQARLLIAGHPREKEIAAEVDALVAELGVGDSVLMTPSPALPEFQDMIVATDAVIGLRWPTAGETSAVMMRAFGAGRPFITTDLPQHRHFDPAFCRLVAVDPAREGAELVAHLERVAARPDEARAAGRLARDYVREHASWPAIARGYLAAAATASTPGAHRPPPTAHRPGANLVADVRAVDSGPVRAQAAALAGAEVNLTFTEFNTRRPDRSLPVPRALDDLRRGKDYPIDVWMVGLDDFDLVPAHALDRYTIGVWSTERPEPTPAERARLSRVDEVWAPSSFVADLFRTATDAPIHVIPPVVTPPAADSRPPAGVPVVATWFDARDEARHNPWAALEAFGRAFPGGDGARLVVGAHGLADDPGAAARLARAAADLGGALVHTGPSTADRAELLSTCDIYLSMHRCAGFGPDMAEAMARGKAVVATGYGGNLDYMPPGSSALVGYGMRRVDDVAHPVPPELVQLTRPGAVWADPDLDQAARWLRRLATSAALRRSMGAAAAEAVRQVCAPEVVGAAMARRLWELRSRSADRTMVG